MVSCLRSIQRLRAETLPNDAVARAWGKKGRKAESSVVGIRYKTEAKTPYLKSIRHLTRMFMMNECIGILERDVNPALT